MNTAALPARTADTMSEAIAIASPNGRTSKRAKDAAVARLSLALFGPDGMPEPSCAQPTRAERLRREAADLRDYAARVASYGHRASKFLKAAAKLEAEADAL